MKRFLKAMLLAWIGKKLLARGKAHRRGRSPRDG
jgi:hypothetical protein